jgi:predicted  nucleic acid-binding Zn-ribbon protein
MCGSVCEEFGLKLKIDGHSELTSHQLNDFRVRKKMRSEMTQMRSEMTQMRSEMTQMRSEMMQMQQSIESLQSTVESLVSAQAQMQKQMNDNNMATQARIKSLGDQMAAFIRSQSSRKRKAETETDSEAESEDHACGTR